MLWRWFTNQVRSTGMHRDPDKARAWLEDNLPGLPELAEDRWQGEWPRFQERTEALLFLAAILEQRPRRSCPPQDVVPDAVGRLVDEVLASTRLRTGQYVSEGLRLFFSGEYNAHPRFATLNELWEVVFVSLFAPQLLPRRAHVCSECGQPLPLTAKRKKPSRARLCKRCTLQKYRRQNPERVRAYDRQAKRRERELNRQAAAVAAQVIHPK